MLEFIYKYSAITFKLNDLFGYRFVPDRQDSSTYVGTLLFQIMSYNNNGDIMARDFELDRLAFLVQHLENLKTHNIQLFKHYIRELKKQERQDSYWGIRFEISIASSFIEKKIKFIKQETPDFIVNDILGVECSSMRIRKLNEKLNFDYKISSLINKKAKNKYNNASTALYVDFTNILYNLISKKIKVDPDEIRIYTENSIKSSNFGSILLFALVHTHDQLEQNYLRIDNVNLDPNLKVFLDKYYSMGNHYIKGYSTSFES